MSFPLTFPPARPLGAIGDLWVFWGLSWLLAAPFAARPTKRSRWMVVPVGVIATLAYLFGRRLGQGLQSPLWPVSQTLGWLLAGLVLSGIAFAWWARLTLGRLWSGLITLKEGHTIIDHGPYGLVRHPIYTGILLSAAATALAMPSAFAFAVLGAILVTLTTKAWAEERFLCQELGEEAYAAYRARVPMLVPFLPK